MPAAPTPSDQQTIATTRMRRPCAWGVAPTRLNGLVQSSLLPKNSPEASTGSWNAMPMRMPGTREEAGGKAETILRRRRARLSGQRLRRGDDGRDRARGRRLEGHGLRPLRQQGRTVRRGRGRCQRASGSPASRRSELDPGDIEASLMTIARRFLDLVLSPEAIAVNRIIIGEVTRFPALGEVFWAGGPERTRAADRGLSAPRRRQPARWRSPIRGSPPSNSARSCAAKSICAACSTRSPEDAAALTAAAGNAVATFLRAFAR